MERRQFIRKSFTSAAVASTGAGLLAGGLLPANTAVSASGPVELREQVLKEVRESVEIAKRMNTKFIYNVLGMRVER